MGVQGLTQVIENHQEIYRDVEFKNEKLVIDGSMIIFHLYLDSGLDRIRGGEYVAFEALIERFVKTLRDCGISPYVVLDGGKDLTGRKGETLILRSEDLIKKACRAAEENKQEKILPQMVNLVFKQTLIRLKVPMAQCYTEADWEIAALAKEWKCPVLSKDSDFFICDLPGGLLPLPHFKWENVTTKDSQSFIPCKIYWSKYFCDYFKIQPQILPAFAALAGNDYVNLVRMKASINWAKHAPAVDGKPQHYLVRMLHWLKKFKKPEEAFEEALMPKKDLSKGRREEIKKRLNQGMEVYKLPLSSLEKFFNNSDIPPYPEAEEKNASWTLPLLMEGWMTSDILDVLLLHRISLSISVDERDKPSANLTSRPIRQVMYRLLLGRDEEVIERDREGNERKEFSVRPEASGVALKLKLQTLNKVEPSVRLQVLLEVLGVSEDSLKDLHHDWHLLVAATCFWLQQAEPKPDQTLLKALLLVASHGDSIRGIPDQTPSEQQLDTDVLHSLNQWQACLQHSVYLNQLLNFPLPEPQIARCYEGTLVHRLVQMMRMDQNPKDFLKNESSKKEYRSMLAVTLRFCSKKYEASSEAHEELYYDVSPSVKTRYRAKRRRSTGRNSLIIPRKRERRGIL